MKILYIFPHPDDESFGPAAGIHKQIFEGHEVYLLTLTRGGATRQRHKLGYSIEEMGKVRLGEMLEVEKMLKLSGMTVLDMPDSGLKEMDPRDIEQEIRTHIETIKPDILVTYPVHGISGFHDHLVTHACVKRLYLELRETRETSLQRLAFFTIPDNGEPSWTAKGPRLRHSEPEIIDCITPLSPENIEAMKRSLACYATYRETIEESGVVKKIGDKLHFEFFGEDFSPPVRSLTEGLIR